MRDLLLISIDGLAYGMWEDEVLFVEELHSLHHIPLSPSCIAGLSIVHDRTAALADLAACLGHAPRQKSGNAHVLIMSDRGPITGFVIPGEPGRLSVSPELIHPMPDYLKTPVIDSCVRSGPQLIPVINLDQLFSRIDNNDNEPAYPPGFTAVPEPTGDIPEIPGFRLIEIDGELFALPGKGVEAEGAAPGMIFPLQCVPQFVLGMTLYREEILPIIDIGRRISSKAGNNKELMLAAEISGMHFGLLIDEDRGTIRGDQCVFRQLPPIAGSRWMQAALVHEGMVIPVLHPRELLSIGPENAREEESSIRYTPDSAFSGRFGREDVEVMEFSLLGSRQALPQSEVEADIEIKPCRPIPNALPIVIGVLEHQGELLPVLDLAMVFGIRSRMTPAWRMMVVRNGDFRALVVTDAVFGSRKLARGVQRAVPIVLPHRVVYGCYPDRESVSLILNVMSLALHFRESPVQDLFPALSKEMKQPTTDIAFAFAASRDPRGHQLSAEATEEPERKIEMESGKGGIAAGAEGIAASADNGMPDELITRKSAETDQFVPETGSAPPASAPFELKGTDAVGAMEKEASAPEQQGEKSAADRSAENPPGGTAPDSAIEQGARAQEWSLASAEPEPVATRDRAGFVPVTSADQTKREHGPGHAREETRGAGPIIDLPENHATKESKPAPGPLSTPSQAIPSARNVRQEPGEGETRRIPSSGSRGASDKKRKRRRRMLTAVLSLSAVLILYLSGFFEKPPSKTAGTKPAASRPEQEMSRPPKAPKETLVLEIPAERNTGIHEYIVREGDTLWDISGRFTGNPENYPHIAGENRIADPDLIFPGQKIYFRKQKATAAGR